MHPLLSMTKKSGSIKVLPLKWLGIYPVLGTEITVL